MKKPKNVLGPDYRVWHGLSDSFRQNVLLVINPHMGPLLAKSRASSFLRAVDSLLIFQQLPRSRPASFPESRHPPLNRMAPSLAAGEEETWESSWFCVFNFGSFFHVTSLWLSVFSQDREFLHFVHSFTHVFIQQIVTKHLLCAGRRSRLWGCSSGWNYNGVCILVGRGDYVQEKAIYQVMSSDTRKMSRGGEDAGWEAAICAGGKKGSD